jgi:SAM-dependent methyltransferase
MVTHTGPHNLLHASAWVQRWSHLAPQTGQILDLACGHGRHMKWFSDLGHEVIGVDRSQESLNSAASYGQVVEADIESGPWPLLSNGQFRQFSAVIVTHYLWRPLFPAIIGSVAPGGLLIYETFSHGNETLGKPSRPDFLLQPAELLVVFGKMQIIAFEEGLLDSPLRHMQRIAAIKPAINVDTPHSPKLYPL